MSKYSEEFKLKVVKYYIEGHHGYKDTANYFNMKQDHTVLKLVRKYQEHGKKGLIKNNQKYDGKFKQNVVEYMHIFSALCFTLGSTLMCKVSVLAIIQHLHNILYVLYYVLYTFSVHLYILFN